MSSDAQKLAQQERMKVGILKRRDLMWRGPMNCAPNL